MNSTLFQVDESGELRHLLNLETLPKKYIEQILNTANIFLKQDHQSSKQFASLLSRKTIMNLFFEHSTRTRSSFELAGKRLGANVINFDYEFSSAKKGETLTDTINNLDAMATDLFVIRHPSSGAAEFVVRHLKSNAAVINAGDGCHEHPSQGLLDLFTIRYFKPDLKKLKVTIVGDILHSRVARSQIYAFLKMGISQIRVVGPKTLIPSSVEKLGVSVFHSMEEGIEGADVIILLRLQLERMQNTFIPSQEEYFRLYALTSHRLSLAKPDVIVMHPGPINRNVEISSQVADGPHSVILKQVTFGTAIRMAIITTLLKANISELT